MTNPLGVPGVVGTQKCDCLLSTLADAIAKRIVSSSSTPIRRLEVEDIAQDLILHVVKSWRYWTPEACPMEAAIRQMVGQGASRVVKKINRQLPHGLPPSAYQPDRSLNTDFSLFEGLCDEDIPPDSRAG